MSDIDGSGLEKGVLEMLSPNKGLEELKIPSYPTLNFQIGLVTIFFYNIIYPEPSIVGNVGPFHHLVNYFLS